MLQQSLDTEYGVPRREVKRNQEVANGEHVIKVWIWYVFGFFLTLGSNYKGTTMSLIFIEKKANDFAVR